MKALPCIFLICLLLANSGCMTAYIVEVAHGSTYKDQNGQAVVDEPPKPGFYALIPLTVAGDIVTAPFQLILVLMMKMSGIQC